MNTCTTFNGIHPKVIITQTHKQNLNIGTKDQRSLYDSSSGDHEHLYRIYWKAIQ